MVKKETRESHFTLRFSNKPESGPMRSTSECANEPTKRGFNVVH